MSEFKKLQEHIVELKRRGGGSTTQPIELLQSLLNSLRAAEADAAMLSKRLEESANHVHIIESERDQELAKIVAAEDEAQRFAYQHALDQRVKAKLTIERDLALAKIEAAEKQDPLYQIMRDNFCWSDISKSAYDLNKGNQFSKTRIVYALPPMPAAEPKQEGAVTKFLALAEELIDQHPYLYMEIARTRTTDYMVWLRKKPDGHLIVSAQGGSVEEACQEALDNLAAADGKE